jgi:hypothetical protein
LQIETECAVHQQSGAGLLFGGDPVAWRFVALGATAVGFTKSDSNDAT